jgi:DegV family protein with EDD domain
MRIVTDSTCDLPPEWFDRYRLTIVPVNILFGLHSFQEGIDIDPPTFYQRIQTTGQLPTTAQPSIGQFREVYSQLTAGQHQVLSIHLSSQLSGTWQSARLAAQEFKGQVLSFDSQSGSVGLGLMVREAAELVEAGWTLDRLVPHLEQRRRHLKVFILLKDLHYARMSGRVGRIRETLASLLQVKPIVGVEAGSLALLEQVRGQKQGVARMIGLAKEALGNSPIHVAVAHAAAPDLAAYLLTEARAHLNCRDSFVTDLATSIAVHFGPGAVGFAAYPAELIP